MSPVVVIKPHDSHGKSKGYLHIPRPLVYHDTIPFLKRTLALQVEKSDGTHRQPQESTVAEMHIEGGYPIREGPPGGVNCGVFQGGCDLRGWGGQGCRERVPRMFPKH